MIAGLPFGWLIVALHVGLQAVFVARALLRPHREPASRLAWVVVILVAPIVGMVAYVLFGETNIGRRRIGRLKMALARLPSFAEIGRHAGEAEAEVAGALPAAVPPRPVDQRLPGGRRQPRPAARRLRRRDRPYRRRHRRGARPCPRLLLHLAARHQRPEGRRGAEAGGRARRHLPGDGRRPRQPARWCAPSTGAAWARPGSGSRWRCRSASRCRARSRAGSTCATTARSWSSTTASPTAAATTAPTPPSRSSRGSPPGSTR